MPRSVAVGTIKASLPDSVARSIAQLLQCNENPELSSANLYQRSTVDTALLISIRHY